MLLENHFPEDVRVRQEAYKLVEYGYQVTVLAQLSEKGQARKELVNGVTVYRIPLLEIFAKSAPANSLPGKIYRKLLSTIGYLAEYAYFTSACFVYSCYILFKEGFDAIHLHNPPNTPFVVGAFFRLLGKKFVFDHHDLAPELYLSRVGRREGGLVYRALMLEEKLCLRSANLVISTNESYQQIAIQRGGKYPENVFVVRNGPDLSRAMFQPVPPDPQLQAMGKKILVYLGVMGPQDGVDYLVRALKELRDTLGRNDFYCLIIGKGESVAGLKQLAAELGLNDSLRFTGFVPTADLVRYLSSADICLDPNPSSPLNDVSTWVKVLEYMAFAKPVVSFDLKETRTSAGKAALYVEPNNELAYAKAIAALMDDPAQREAMGRFGRERLEKQLSWAHVSRNLIIAYDRLFGHPERITTPGLEHDL